MPRAWPLTTTRSSISRFGNMADRTRFDLPHHRLIRAEQELLPGLTARVEGARHLGAAERSVVEQPAVFARERHPLRDALVDDVDAELREPEDVGLARAVVASLDGVVEEPLNAVAVVLVVLGGVDATLRRDAVCAPRAVVDAEALDVVAELAERRRRRRPGQAGADDEDGVFPPVGGVHQLRFELVPVPLLGQRPARNLGSNVIFRPGGFAPPDPRTRALAGAPDPAPFPPPLKLRRDLAGALRAKAGAWLAALRLLAALILLSKPTPG